MSSTHKPLKNNTSVLFNAYLRPNRSLTPFGFKMLMISILTVLIICGVGASMIGAWPVLGFFGLDLVLVYFAFRLSYQSGGSYEVISVTADELRVTKVSHSGQKQVATFQPYWLRISLEESSEDDKSLIDNSLIVSSHGQSVSIGACLAPEERHELAQELGHVLRTLRSKE